jgi:hypothetical protein
VREDLRAAEELVDLGGAGAAGLVEQIVPLSAETGGFGAAGGVAEIGVFGAA